MMSVYALYALDKPDEYKYVGVTSLSLERRLQNHISVASDKARIAPVFQWVRSMRVRSRQGSNYAIGIKLLAKANKQDACKLEQSYIHSLLRSGHKLLNVNGVVYQGGYIGSTAI